MRGDEGDNVSTDVKGRQTQEMFHGRSKWKKHGKQVKKQNKTNYFFTHIFLFLEVGGHFIALSLFVNV